VCRNSDLHRPSLVLLGCLAVSDLLTGIIAQPSMVVYVVAKYYQAWMLSYNTQIFFGCSGIILFGVSLGTLTVISVDRFLALHFHLRYKELVTNPRVLAVFVLLWPTMIIVVIPKLLRQLNIVIVILLTATVLCIFVIDVLLEYLQNHPATPKTNTKTRKCNTSRANP